MLAFGPKSQSYSKKQVKIYRKKETFCSGRDWRD